MSSRVIKYKFPEDIRKIEELPGKLLRLAYEELRTQAENMRDLAKVYVLVDTGSLRDSIRLEDVPTTAPDFMRSIRVRAGGYVVNPKTHRLVDYAVFVEAKEPFLSRAWHDVEENIMEVLSRLHEKVV